MLHDTKILIEEFENMKNIPMFELQEELYELCYTDANSDFNQEMGA